MQKTYYLRYRWARNAFAGLLMVVLSAGLFRVECFASDSGDGIPRRIVIMIADGAGFNHFNAASIFLHGETGKHTAASMPVGIAVSTYPRNGSYDSASAWGNWECVATSATDSAAAATAMACGVKTLNGRIGVDENMNPVSNVMEVAESRRKSTGVITSVAWAEATPAGFVAHVSRRAERSEIARYMLEDSAIDVIMGSGHPDDMETTERVGGREKWAALRDGRLGGDADGDGVPDHWRPVEGRAAMLSLTNSPVAKRAVGTFRGRKWLPLPGSVPDVPTLAEMSLTSLELLDRNPKGFVLMIEGGAPDICSHENDVEGMISQMTEFLSAVEAVRKWASSGGRWKDTLLIVTADHETGYLVSLSAPEDSKCRADAPLVNNGKGALPGVKWLSMGHTNQLVPLWAEGAGSRRLAKLAVSDDLVRGKYMDNTGIAHVVMEFLAKDGPVE